MNFNIENAEIQNKTSQDKIENLSSSFKLTSTAFLLFGNRLWWCLILCYKFSVYQAVLFLFVVDLRPQKIRTKGDFVTKLKLQFDFFLFMGRGAY